jgi:hypothetical protein
MVSLHCSLLIRMIPDGGCLHTRERHSMRPAVATFSDQIKSFGWNSELAEHTLRWADMHYKSK